MYKIGDVIKTRVTGITKYGIFVNVDTLYTGLIHISEVSNEFVRNINDYVRIDEIIYCEIMEIDEENKQLKLSIKNINYKEDGSLKGIVESKNGFKPLKDNLNIWINEKLAELQKHD